MIKDITDFETIEEGLNRLSALASYRDASEDETFYQVWTRDCQTVASKLINLGVDKMIVAKAAGWVNV